MPTFADIWRYMSTQQKPPKIHYLSGFRGFFLLFMRAVEFQQKTFLMKLLFEARILYLCGFPLPICDKL